MTRAGGVHRALQRNRVMLRGWHESAREAWDMVRETLSGGGALLPPVWLRDVGPSDFETTGQEFLQHFIELGGLRPSESVLEIGCGPGRMALPLTRYLSHEGHYVGMDIAAPAIRWCRRNISRRHPNFRFYHAAILNRRYNPSGTVQPSEYVFPFGEDSFDFVLLTSVFTHMFPTDTRRYLREIARLLRPFGRLFCTFFLLNPGQEALARRGVNEIDFRYDYGGFRARDAEVPESAIAVDEEVLCAMMRDARLAVREPIRYGSWSGRQESLSFQDVLVAEPSVGRSTADS